jgi:hypothetical protein
MRSRASGLWLALAVLAPVAAGAEPLVGPSVGNAEALVAEGTSLYNQKDYPAAAEALLKATRANPRHLPAYLSLARSLLAARKLAQACYAYRAFVRGGESPDRQKAESELELCERQLEADPAAQKERDFGAALADLKAGFFAALEKGDLTQAAESLGRLVKGGYLGVDLADMASRLSAAAAAQGEQAHRAALAGELREVPALEAAARALQLAAETGPAPAAIEARTALLAGLVELYQGRPKQAEELFARAGSGEGAGPSPVLWRARALVQVDRRKAVQLLESERPNDPRTGAARVAAALPDAPGQAAADLEKLLFEQRFPSGR